MTYEEYIKYAEEKRIKLTLEWDKKVEDLRSAFKAGRESDQSENINDCFEKYLSKEAVL